MHSTSNTYVLSREPGDGISADVFRLEARALPALQDGEVLVQNAWLSVDPYMRLSLTGLKGLHASKSVGDEMTGGAVGQVVQSRAPALPEGSWVLSSQYGWRDRYVAKAGEMQPISDRFGPVRRYLGVYGLTGITAYAGMVLILNPQPGESVLVSGGAGAVGSVAVQLAKRAGARCIVSAGSEEKGGWLVDELGADAFINYRSPNFRSELEALTPNGLDLFFDGVGGMQLETAIDLMAPKGRIVLLGAIAQYESDNYRQGPSNFFGIIEKGLSLKGLNAGQFYGEADRIVSDLASMIDDGKLIWRETVVDGLERMPGAFCEMLSGNNTGKMLIRLEPAGQD